MIQFLFLISRQGKTRLAKWYVPFARKEKNRILREIGAMVLTRPSRLCNFLEWREYKIVYKRYASLYFIAVTDPSDNELITLEIIHHFVEVLDKYFGNVCELDLIFNFHQAYYMLDEILIAGELQETSKKSVLRVCHAQDSIVEDEEIGKSGKKKKQSSSRRRDYR